MISLLSFLSGSIISIMVLLNGSLSQCVGSYYATFITRSVGSIFSFLICLIKKKTFKISISIVILALLGGIFGTCSTILTNYSYAYISMTSIVALTLLGQTLASSLVDQFGLFNMKKAPISSSTIVGLIVSLLGVGLMFDASINNNVLAVILSILSGIAVVLSRVVNANLTKKTDTFTGSFYNYLMGLPFCLLMWGYFDAFHIYNYSTPALYMYLGGILGVISLLILVTVIPHISAYNLSLLSFLGQQFTGFIIDVIYNRFTFDKMFYGAFICALGFGISLILKQRKKGVS